MDEKYIDLFAGASGSLASLFVVWPSEVIKYQRQHDTLRYDPKSLYRRSYFQIIKELFPFGYYRGVTPALITVMPRNALPLILYDKVKKVVDEKTKNRIFSSLMTGTILSLTNSTIAVPFVNLSLRKILDSSTTSSVKNRLDIRGAHRGVYRGVYKGLYSGFTGCCVNDFIRIGLKFMIYSEISKSVERVLYSGDTNFVKNDTIDVDNSDNGGNSDNSGNGGCVPQNKAPKSKIMISAISGGLSSALIAVATNPLDTCITHQQSQSMNMRSGTASPHPPRTQHSSPPGLRSSLFYILNRNGPKQGLKDLYSGFILRSLRGIPGGFVMFGTYEYIKNKFV